MNRFPTDNRACKRWRRKPDGTAELVPKVQHETMDKAIEAAKTMNASHKPGDLKVVAYKCSTCHMYHIGTNGNKIKP